MKICDKCGDRFPYRKKIDGKIRSLRNRKYCLNCSPFGSKNTKKLNGKLRKGQVVGYKCSCGATDPNEFYNRMRSTCKACHIKTTTERGLETKLKAIAYLGGSCEICGYDKYYGALAFHHTSPAIKDSNFKGIRSWSWGRVIKELENCKLLCHNCHCEVHSNLVEL